MAKTEEYFEIKARKTGGPYQTIGMSKDLAIASRMAERALKGRYKSSRIYEVKTELLNEIGRTDCWLCGNCGSLNARVEKHCHECSTKSKEI